MGSVLYENIQIIMTGNQTLKSFMYDIPNKHTHTIVTLTIASDRSKTDLKSLQLGMDGTYVR
jgi:hypothetical protein